MIQEKNCKTEALSFYIIFMEGNSIVHSKLGVLFYSLML
jgi:hypothetical protein